MTKMFDKVSDSFLDAIKSVLEAKKTNKHGHDEVGKEDDDIDNDGDEDSSDKYLHNRRKAIGKAMMKKEEAQIDEISADMKGRYKKAAQHSLDSAQDFKAELDHEGEPKGSRVRKDVNRIIKNRKMGMKRANEEAQIDELSKAKLLDYMDKASDARGHRKLSTKKVDNRYAGVKKASDKLAKEEVEQLDELSPKTLGSYIKKATHQAVSKGTSGGMAMAGNHGPEGEAQGIKLVNKAFKRTQGVAKATDKLTKEEIEMIEAKMAGVAPGSMDCDKHMCATKVFHKEWNEGTPIKTMHAEPDADGLIEWYDVMFDHGIERVMTEDMEILQAESHMHSKKKMKEEAEELDEDIGAQINELIRKKNATSSPIARKNIEAQIAKLKRQKSKMAEEVEELDELSHDTLRRYRMKAKSIGDNEKGDINYRAKGRELAGRKSYGGRMAGIEKAKVMAKEEAEGLDESVAKAAAHLIKRYGDNVRKSHVRSAANDLGVGYVALSHHVRKKLGVNRLEEARGRPKKMGAKDFTVHPVTKEKLMHNNPEHMKKIERLQKHGVLEKPKREADQHIMNQLSKAKTSMRGGETIHFTHGESKHVSGTHAAKLLTKYAGMKPSEKEDFQKKIGHSHEQLMKHV